MTESCVVKETPEAEVCQNEVFTHLTTTYSFDTDERFDFSIPICEDHYERLVERYKTEFADFAIGSEE